MAEKRKSVFKRPSRRRRNRSSTPVPDLLSPYLPGPELFISSPISAIQTRPVYLSATVDSSPRGVFFSSIGHVPYSGSNPTLSFDSNPIPPNFSVFHTESGVVQDFSSRSTAQFALPRTGRLVWAFWVPVLVYIDSTQSNPMTSTSSNSQYGVQRFFEEFRLPDYTLDSFSGRLLDVVANIAFSSGNVQVELRHAITRLLIFVYLYIIKFWPFYIRSLYIGSSNFVYDLCIFLDCLTYWNQGCVILLTAEARFKQVPTFNRCLSSRL